ncbi:hypothetical protein GCM10009742_27140 [Kribbella karoonensis]|uniref:Uncharacterized protein n=1 Tax=Kribbella karoonensis TaxID=324851 RepID=A0ABN2DNB5_9ACTN
MSIGLPEAAVASGAAAMPSIEPAPVGLAFAYAAQPGPTIPPAALLADGVSLVVMLGLSAGAEDEVLVEGELLELLSLLPPQAAVVSSRAAAVVAKPARTIFRDMTISFLMGNASGSAHLTAVLRRHGRAGWVPSAKSSDPSAAGPVPNRHHE